LGWSSPVYIANINFYALKTNSLAKSFTNGFCIEIDFKITQI